MLCFSRRWPHIVAEMAFKHYSTLLTMTLYFCSVVTVLLPAVIAIMLQFVFAAVRQSKKHDEQRRSIARVIRASFDESVYVQVDIVRSLHNIKASPKPQPSSVQ